MADSANDGSTNVTEASKTSGEANPMSTAPAEPTAAQVEQTEVQAGIETGVNDGPSEESKQQAKEDADWRGDHPNEVLIREANPDVGGESFGYLDHVSG